MHVCICFFKGTNVHDAKPRAEPFNITTVKYRKCTLMGSTTLEEVWECVDALLCLFKCTHLFFDEGIKH